MIATDFLFLGLTEADIINKIKLDVSNAFFQGGSQWKHSKGK